MPNPLRILPLFSDLMLLPRTVDELANVTVRDSRIYVRTEQLESVCVVLAPYPNIRVERTSATELIIHAVQLTAEMCVIYWPDGKRIGMARYAGNWFTRLSPDSVDNLMACGMATRIVQAHSGETEEQALHRTDTLGPKS